MEQYRLKRLWLLVPGVLALVLTGLAQISPQATEAIFSRSIYPWWSSAWGFLPSLVSFSVAQWVVVAALFAVVAFVIYYAIQLMRGRGKRLLVLWRAIATALAALSVGFFLFATLCGLNYYRCTFAEEAGFELRESSPEELAALCENLAANMNAARTEIEGSPDAYAEAHGGFEAYAHEALENMAALAQAYPALQRPLYSPPKPVLFSRLMSYADIAGMYFPFTVESNINTDGPFFTIPATMGHELAHQCGFMREDEANFIGYLACKNAADPVTRYSGYSLAYDYAIGALSRVDADAARAIAATLSPEVQEDRRQRAAYLQQFAGPVAQLSNSVNNAYLKANQQQDGTQSYGRMVDLLLAEVRQG